MAKYQVCILEEQGEAWRHGYIAIEAASEADAQREALGPEGQVDDDRISWGDWNTPTETPQFRVVDVRKVK